MYYIYIPFQGRRIYWNRITQRWLTHLDNASPFTLDEAKNLCEGSACFGIAIDRFKDK